MHKEKRVALTKSETLCSTNCLEVGVVHISRQNMKQVFQISLTSQGVHEYKYLVIWTLYVCLRPDETSTLCASCSDLSTQCK